MICDLINFLRTHQNITQVIALVYSYGHKPMVEGRVFYKHDF